MNRWCSGEEAQAEDTLTAYEQKQNDELFVEEGDSSVYEAYPRKVGDMKDVYRVTANAASDSDNKLRSKRCTPIPTAATGRQWALQSRLQNIPTPSSICI